jgi:hypothetical protein
MQQRCGPQSQLLDIGSDTSLNTAVHVAKLPQQLLACQHCFSGLRAYKQQAGAPADKCNPVVQSSSTCSTSPQSERRSRSRCLSTTS